MQSISLRDIKRLPVWGHLEETEIINRKYDEKLLPILYALGIDIEKAFTYYAANHRDMSGYVGVGIRCVGDIRQDREYELSGMCSTFDRIVISGKKDTSLMVELCGLAGRVLDYRSFFAEHEVDESKHDVWPNCMTEGDYQDVGEVIKGLDETILAVRGNPFNDEGLLKMWDE